MLLAIDIGNTSVSFALFKSNCTPIVQSKISVQKNRSSDEYAVLINQILDLHLPDGFEINHTAISSVVPSVTTTVAHAAETLSSNKPYIIGPGTKTGFKISINDPACLGSDIVSNVAAAMDFCKPPFIVFDAGTANTITVVDENSSLIGTIIMPGIRISASALNDNAELLDNIDLSNPKLEMIGKNTSDSIKSGLVYGNSMMLDGFVRNIRESLIPKDSDTKLGLVATGGFAELIVDNCRNKFIIDNSLTLKGIATLFMRNMSK